MTGFVGCCNIRVLIPRFIDSPHTDPSQICASLAPRPVTMVGYGRIECIQECLTPATLVSSLTLWTFAIFSY